MPVLMPDVIEAAPADTVQPVVPVAPQPGADNQPSTDVVPEAVKGLMDRLFTEPEPANAPKKREEAKPEPEKPEPTKAKVEPAKPTPTPNEPAQPDIRLRKPKAPTRPELPIAAPVAPVAPAREEPYKSDAQWESTLEETEREMLADAKFMEERFPDKYKGWAAKTAKFLREHEALTTKQDFDDQSPAYKQWVTANQPRLSREQIREIEHARVTDAVKKEYEPKLAELQHKQFVRDFEPKIEAEGKQTFAELTRQALPDEVMSAIQKDGYEKASSEYGLEIETAQAVLGAATADIIEFKRITTRDPETGRPLQAPVENPSDPKYAQHQRLSEMVKQIGEHFHKNAPAEKQLRDGKWFVTRDEWNQIRPDQRGRYWTFTNAELIDAAKANMKAVVAQAIEQKRAYLTKLGYQRPTKTEAPKTVPKIEPPPTPTNNGRIPAGAPVPGPTEGVPTEVEARAKRMAAALGRDNLS